MTAGEARKLIARSRREGGISRCNPSMTHQQALDVLEAAIKQRGDNEDLAGIRSGLMERNLLREIGRL